MKPHWHPLSTLYIKEPASVASPIMVRMLLSGEGLVELVYAGDSMSPAIRHGQSLTACRPRTGAIPAGTVLLVLNDAIPDIFRLANDDGETVQLSADAGGTLSLPRESVLGEIDLRVGSATSSGARSRNRFWLDIKEAWYGSMEEGAEAAESVRDKYEAQAGYYAQQGRVRIDPRLLDRIRTIVPAAGRILVVGSGAGHESVALAKTGFETVGIEFAESMIDYSRREAHSAGVEVQFVQADIREHVEPAASIDLVHFTYDVYSFIPGREQRIRLLQRLREWLRPGGSILLSARRAVRTYDRAILSLQWLAGLRRGAVPEWGDSHTRWLTTTGEMRRSFVRVFSHKQLRDEAAAAGLQSGEWQQGHQRLSLPQAALIPPASES